jgi:hypothetical protein
MCEEDGRIMSHFDLVAFSLSDSIYLMLMFLDFLISIE